MQGKIIKQISNDYTVELNNHEKIICKPRGKFRNMHISPLVGDIVDVDYDNKYILDILPRNNELVRPAIVNVDQAVIIASCHIPNFSSNLLDKFINHSISMFMLMSTSVLTFSFIFVFIPLLTKIKKLIFIISKD